MFILKGYEIGFSIMFSIIWLSFVLGFAYGFDQNHAKIGHLFLPQVGKKR
jgi:hypothetical protein